MSTMRKSDIDRKEDMSEHEIYTTFCAPRFKAIEDKVNDIHKVICGNGHEGIADTARNNKKWIGRVMWALGTIFVALIGLVCTIIAGSISK